MKKKKETQKLVESKKKIVLFIAILSIVIIVISLGVTLYFNNLKSKEESNINKILENNKKAFLKVEEKEEYGMELSYDDILKKLVDIKKLEKDTKIELSINNEELKNDKSYKFDKVGIYKVDVKLIKEYKYKIITEINKEIIANKEYKIEIVDTTFPEINGVKDREIIVGDTINVLDGITAIDKVDGNLEVKSEGSVDTSKAGTYTIKVNATDKNGNKTEKEFKVTVKNKTVTNNKKNSGSSSSSNSSTSSSSSSCSTSALRKGGYNLSDKDACSKDKQARAVAQNIANEIKAKGYKTDLEKVGAAAEKVSWYYFQGSHLEKGIDYRTPYGVFIKGESSCAGCTRALILVLEYLGYTNTTHVNENQWDHQWVKLYMDGQVGWADGQIGEVGYGLRFGQ